MAKNNEKNTDKKVIEPITFTKEKILKFKRYKYRTDLLNALLDNVKVYTIEEVDSLIDKFMKGKVK